VGTQPRRRLKPIIPLATPLETARPGRADGVLVDLPELRSRGLGNLPSDPFRHGLGLRSISPNLLTAVRSRSVSSEAVRRSASASARSARTVMDVSVVSSAAMTTIVRRPCVG
jgi:hypothetical protein